MTVNVQMIEQLNKKAQFLNAERQKMLGRRESARSAFDKAVFAYQQKYGVTLDDTNLQQEYDKVSSQTQADYDSLNSLILSIESGEYKKDILVPQQQVPLVQQQFVQPVVQQFNSINDTQATPVITEQQVEEHIAPKAANIGAEALSQALLASQNQQPVQQPFNPFAQASQPVAPVKKEEDVSEQTFKPSGWGQMDKPLNQNFADILGGSPTGLKFGQ